MKPDRKTVIAAVIMAVPFLGCMYLIFGGGEKTVQEGTALNTTLPDGKAEEIIASRQRAIEQEELRRQQDRTGLSLEGDSFGLINSGSHGTETQDSELRRSQEAYRTATAQVNSFYSSPRSTWQNDRQIEDLKRQVDELNARLERQAAVPDPMELAEKRYEAAARMLGLPGQSNISTEAAKEPRRKSAVTVLQSRVGNVVSSLSPPVVGEHFRTAVGAAGVKVTNTLHAQVDTEQSVSNGDRIRLRLSEPALAGDHVFPAGTILFGTASITDQRVNIIITSIGDGGTIRAVELEAYDTDGQCGLYVPDSAERTAVRNAAAAAGQSVGGGITISDNVAGAVVADASRAVISAGTQYLSSKLQKVKVTIPDGYKVYLISKEQ